MAFNNSCGVIINQKVIKELCFKIVIIINNLKLKNLIINKYQLKSDKINNKILTQWISQNENNNHQFYKEIK